MKILDGRTNLSENYPCDVVQFGYLVFLTDVIADFLVSYVVLFQRVPLHYLAHCAQLVYQVNCLLSVKDLVEMR